MVEIESGVTGKAVARSGKIKKKKLVRRRKRHIAEIAANSNAVFYTFFGVNLIDELKL